MKKNHFGEAVCIAYIHLKSTPVNKHFICLFTLDFIYLLYLYFLRWVENFYLW